jgi:hypothetical protein
MTREDIIRMAREAEDYADTIYEKGEYHPGKSRVEIWLEVRDQRFAALVAAAEREACAKVCEPQDKWDDPLTAWTIAQAIRARGSK